MNTRCAYVINVNNMMRQEDDLMSGFILLLSLLYAAEENKMAVNNDGIKRGVQNKLLLKFTYVCRRMTFHSCETIQCCCAFDARHTVFVSTNIKSPPK